MSRRKSKKSTVNSASSPPKVATRNLTAANPLLGKSGAHGKTRKADRRAYNASLRKLPLERTACRPCFIKHRSGQAIGSSGSLLTAFIVTLTAFIDT